MVGSLGPIVNDWGFVPEYQYASHRAAHLSRLLIVLLWAAHHLVHLLYPLTQAPVQFGALSAARLNETEKATSAPNLANVRYLFA